MRERQKKKKCFFPLIFGQEALKFHFVLCATNYIASPGHFTCTIMLIKKDEEEEEKRQKEEKEKEEEDEGYKKKRMKRQRQCLH